MRCALVLLNFAALVGFSVLQVSGAPGSTVVPSHGSPANLAGFEKVKSVAVAVGLQLIFGKKTGEVDPSNHTTILQER
jgi:hypothetical protein